MSNKTGQYAVTSRTYDWRQMVLKEWGQEFYMNDIAYEFVYPKESTDKYKTGIYNPNLT